MKSLFFTISLVIAFAFNAHSQKMAAQLQSKKWFANGVVGKGTITLRAAETAKAANQWQAVFSSTGRMGSCTTLTSDIVDMTGVTYKSGSFYCDSTCVYTVKNDMVNIMMTDQSYYYKMKALPNSEGIELIPASKEDFK